MVGYFYIALTILFTVYGQLVLKWRMSLKGELPLGFASKLSFIFEAILDLWILSGFFSAFLGSLAWAAAMTKFELSQAYPFMSLSFVFVTILSVNIFNESITLPKLIGLCLIIVGVVITVQKF